MTDMELAYRKAEIVKERKMCKYNYTSGYHVCNHCNRAIELEILLMEEMLGNPDMTYERAVKLIRQR